MGEPLTADDCRFILRSLEYTKRAFANCTDYPSYQFKCEQIAEVKAVMDKVRAIRDQIKDQT